MLPPSIPSKFTHKPCHVQMRKSFTNPLTGLAKRTPILIICRSRSILIASKSREINEQFAGPAFQIASNQKRRE
jgi:hypothetical protein